MALSGGSEVLGDQDGDDEGIDCDNTGHNDRNETLEELSYFGQSRVQALREFQHYALRGVRFARTGLRTFMIKSGRKVPTPAIPMPDFAVPYAAPAPILHSQLSCAIPRSVVRRGKR